MSSTMSTLITWPFSGLLRSESTGAGYLIRMMFGIGIPKVSTRIFRVMPVVFSIAASLVLRRIADSGPMTLLSVWANLISSASASLPAKTMITAVVGVAAAPFVPGAGVADALAVGWVLVALTYSTRLSWSSVLTVGAASRPVIGSKRGLLDPTESA